MHFIPFSLYAFFDNMVWTKMPIEKFLEENKPNQEDGKPKATDDEINKLD